MIPPFFCFKRKKNKYNIWGIVLVKKGVTGLPVFFFVERFLKLNRVLIISLKYKKFLN